MIGDYIVVAFVYAIGLMFLGVVHHFWLRDVFREERPRLDGRVENEGRSEIYSDLNESSAKVGCRTSQFAIQTSPPSQRKNREHFDPGATTLVGREPKSEKKVLLQKRMPALSQTRVSGRS